MTASDDTERSPRLSTRTGGPALRSDARRNRERVLEAARKAFAASGPDVPLDEIAVLAGVGAGTVYRHFPSKDELFRAVTSEHVVSLSEQARRSASSDDPGAGFFAFVDRLLRDGESKADLDAALALPGPLLEELHEAMTLLLTAAQEAGTVRRDLELTDLLVLLKALLLATRTGDPARPSASTARAAAVLIDGLRAHDG